MHPLLLPTLIAEMETSRVLSTYEKCFRNVLDQDRLFSNTMTGESIPEDPAKLPLKDIVAELMLQSTFLTACWRETETWTNALPLMKLAIGEVW